MPSKSIASLTYLPGHGPYDSCIKCPHPSLFKYKDPCLDAVIPIHVPAVALTLYLGYDQATCKKDTVINVWVPDNGCFIFANAYNTCIANYKPNSTIEDKKTQIYHLDYPSPPIETFFVAPYQCVDKEIIFPGNISVPKEKWDRLYNITTDDAMRQNKWRNWALQEKAKVKAKRMSVGHVVGGFAHVDPILQARLDKKKKDTFYSLSGSGSSGSGLLDGMEI
ncbi:hypothetical protein L218DRAFT_1052265 [Marasmius fiardii PR-910]|nr:hypothetical protein L218DRAFT_1052265 [Marasmius fiardii PR-910]